MSQLNVVKHCVIQRSHEVVRAHFLDFDHHIAHGVHRGVDYTVLERLGAQQRVRSKFRVYGMPKVDEILVYPDAEGAVVQDFVRGEFAGGRIRVTFTPDGPTTTRLEATLDVPLRGVNRLIKPLLRRVVEQLTVQALEEDRRDLENGYQPPRQREMPKAASAA
jgi:polyketide cyclase/dehydrase/lipid transport protein